MVDNEAIDMWQTLKSLFQDIDSLTLAVTISVAVLGWIFALWLQNRNIKQQHRIQIRYDIYKQFVQIHKDAQDAISKLGAHTSPPFILMESSMIPFQLNLKKEYKGVWMPYTEQECVFGGEQKWSAYLSALFNDYSSFSNKFLLILYVTEDWAAPLKSLLPVKQILHKEIGRLKKQIHTDLAQLQGYAGEHGHDWRKWDKKKIEKISARINESAMAIGSYLDDFMVLIHNELLSEYFRYKRPTRKTLDPQFKVLTKDGIVEKIDWDMLKKMKTWKTTLTSYATEKLNEANAKGSKMSEEYREYLSTVASGNCPSCGSPLNVIEGEVNEDNFHFRYACGHGFNGVALKDSIAIREAIKIKGTRKGFGLVRKMIQGWRASGDPRLRHGVDYFMSVDREKNEYHQVVKNYETKAVLHEEHEPLTQHKIQTNDKSEKDKK